MIAFNELRDNLFEALRHWHNPVTSTSLSKLMVYRQRYRENGSPEHVVASLLDGSINQLAEYDSVAAQILRLRFQELLVMSEVGQRLGLAHSTVNKKQRQAVDELANILYVQEKEAHETHLNQLETQLSLPPLPELIAVDEPLQRLLPRLSGNQPPWIISIEGLGGIGKTALANRLVREVIAKEGGHDVGWISAKQQDFFGGGIAECNQPALDTATLTNILLKQFDLPIDNLSQEEQEKLLQQQLRTKPYLVVIDNLETVVDYETLLPALRAWSNPTRFLLTSRHSLQAHDGLFCYSLAALSETDSLTFIHREGYQRGLTAVEQLPSKQFRVIYDTVGGNPLALKLVAGQLSMLPLQQVIDSLQLAQDKSVDDLYTYIYWQAWQLLEPASRQALLVMPLVQHGMWSQLQQVSGLDSAKLNPAIQQLCQLSLLNISGELEARCYSIHRLTETFLMNEVTKWQS